MSEVFSNRFHDGINGDIDPRGQSNTTYVDAKNIEIVGTKNLYVAKNLSGTTEVQRIITKNATTLNVHVLGAFKCVGLYDDVYGSGVREYNNSIIIYIFDNTNPVSQKHQIYIYDIVRDSLHLLVDTQELNFNENLVIDAVVHTEQGESSVYFVDDENQLRRVKCVVDGSGTIGYVDVLTVRRFYPSNPMVINDVELGGALPAGSYQFSYRFYSTSDNRYSGWSLLTNPVPVSLDGVDENITNVVGGTSGTITDKKINLTISGSFNSTIYDAIQLAVVKNIDGATTPDLKAYVLNPSTTIFQDPTNFYYSGDAEESTIDIADIVVEDAAIKSFKTLTLKNNRLIAGNVKYNPLDYDNGDIEIDDAYTIKQSLGHGGYRAYTKPQVLTGSASSAQINSTDLVYIITINTAYQGNIFSATSYFFNDIRYRVKPGDTTSDVAHGIYLQILSGLNPVDSSFTITLNNNQIIFAGSWDSDEWGEILYLSSVSAGYETVTTAPAAPYGYKNEINSSSHKSHFRDEVYRYGVTYVDIFGNWSKPKILDFSDFTVMRQTGSPIPVYSVGKETAASVDDGAANGLCYIEVQDWQVASLLPGEYINISGSAISGNNGFFKVIGKETLPATYRISTKVYVDADLTTEGSFASPTALSSTMYLCADSKYNHSEVGCVDWKFPARDTPGFAILDSSSNVQAVGLRIEGIKNHPSWAKGLAIVRAKRRKNIIFQSPHITATAIKQSPQDGPWIFTGNSSGTFGTKTFSLGGARNIGLSANPNNNNALEAAWFRQHQITGQYAFHPLSFLVPPDYMFNTDDESYFEYQYNPGDRVKVVDACSLQMSDNLSSDNGTLADHNIATSFYAETKDNYYYNNANKNLLSFYNQFRFYFDDGKAFIKEVGQVAKQTDPFTFSYFPSNNEDFSNISKFGDYNGISTNDGYTGRNPSIYKGLVLGLNKNFGDLTFVSLNTTHIPASNVSNEIVFGRKVNNTAIDIDYTTPPASSAIRTPTQNASCSTVILNVEKGLSDFRYGDIYNYNEFIFTGTYVELTESDITNNTPVTVDVFGGDCFISKMHIKLSDTKHGVGFPDGMIGSGGTEKWRAVAYDDLIEYITVYVESEVNCDLQSEDTLPTVTGSYNFSDWRLDPIYPYNNGYSVQNTLKVFTPFNPYTIVKNDFPARIPYSDQKIYQSNIQGFDRFRAGSVYDLDETSGAITKIARSNDGNIYAIQEQAVAYIPVEANIISDADGNNLSIRSGDIIGKPNYLSSNLGCQHIGTVQVSDKGIFFVDALHMAVVNVSGGAQRISDAGVISFFNANLSSKIPNHLLRGYYDYNREEYIVSKLTHEVNTYSNGVLQTTSDVDPFVIIFNTKIGKWTTQLSTDDDIKYLNMVYANNNMYITGIDINGHLTLHSLYTGNYGSFLGKVFDSEITFIVNPQPDFPKVFSNLSLNATNRAASIDMVVYKENNAVQTVSGMNFDVIPREGLYKIPILQDTSGARLRGTYAEATIKIDNADNKEVRIFDIITKYRSSQRAI